MIARLQRFKWGMCVASFVLCRAPVLTPFIPSLVRRRHHDDFSPFSGRILMETPRLPTIIPMWVTGALPNIPAPAQRSADEKRRTPSPSLTPPRNPFAAPAPHTVTFGAPLPTAAVGAALGMGQRMHVRGLWNDGSDGDGYGKHQRT